MKQTTHLLDSIGQPWSEVAHWDWDGHYPVLEDGIVRHVVLATTSLADAARRGWIFDRDKDVFVVDAAASDILDELLRYDEGAYGVLEGAADVARDWQAAGFTAERVRQWLTVGVCDPKHAVALEGQGYAASQFLGLWDMWCTDEDVERWLAKTVN